MEEINNIITNSSDNENIIIRFLNSCGIKCQSIFEIDGIILYRNDLIFSNKYNDIKPFINDLRKILSSSVYTSLHSHAEKKQKFPLINIIRQVLKSIDYKLIPRRISDGYTKDGIKKYKRLFVIEKNKNL